MIKLVSILLLTNNAGVVARQQVDHKVLHERHFWKSKLENEKMQVEKEKTNEQLKNVKRCASAD